MLQYCKTMISRALWRNVYLNSWSELGTSKHLIALIDDTCAVCSTHSNHTNDSSLFHLTCGKKERNHLGSQHDYQLVPPVFHKSTQPKMKSRIAICDGNHFKNYLDMLYKAEPPFWANLSKISAWLETVSQNVLLLHRVSQFRGPLCFEIGTHFVMK